VQGSEFNLQYCKKEREGQRRGREGRRAEVRKELLYN
jgi:hypothetical protein